MWWASNEAKNGARKYEEDTSEAIKPEGAGEDGVNVEKKAIVRCTSTQVELTTLLP